MVRDPFRSFCYQCGCCIRIFLKLEGFLQVFEDISIDGLVAMPSNQLKIKRKLYPGSKSKEYLN
jgi:hypothetical protein